jgi:predicted transcriptional regulator
MSTKSNGPRAHLANAVITAHQAVVLSNNGGVGLNGDSTKADGFALTDAASGDYVGVQYLHDSGTLKGQSAVSVIAVGGTLYYGAGGTISSTGTIVAGKALEACSVTGAVIEFIPNTL